MMMHENTPALQASHATVRHAAIRRSGVVSAAYFSLQGTSRWLAAEDGVLTLAGAAGVWITRDNDLDDHVLQPGDSLSVRAGDALIVEPLRRGEQAWLDWQADAAPAQPALPRRAAGLLAGFLATGLLALARSAEAIAKRAQSSIADGASMASAGALK